LDSIVAAYQPHQDSMAHVIYVHRKLNRIWTNVMYVVESQSWGKGGNMNPGKRLDMSNP
jgi:hypothetical protein